MKYAKDILDDIQKNKMRLDISNKLYNDTRNNVYGALEKYVYFIRRKNEIIPDMKIPDTFLSENDKKRLNEIYEERRRNIKFNKTFQDRLLIASFLGTIGDILTELTS